MANEGGRRDEILRTAADVFGSQGLRASLQDVADAAGIQQGSLYHHFDSKDAIYLELVDRYRSELDDLAVKALDPPLDAARERIADRVAALATGTAEASTRHRAALLLTLYEPPIGSSDALVKAASDATPGVTSAFRSLFVAAAEAGEMRTTIDASVLAEHFTVAMLGTGMSMYRTRSGRRFSAVKCQILLHGLAPDTPTDRTLDGSTALRAVSEVVEGWGRDRGTGSKAKIREAARTVFARRGFEATTTREIAAEAGMSLGGMYRHMSSKQQIFEDIMQNYADRLDEGWIAVTGSSSSALEKLDALLWLGVHLHEWFGPEHRIQGASMRHRPPADVRGTYTFPAHMRVMEQLLADGSAAGELDLGDTSLEASARATYALMWIPEVVEQMTGLREAHRLGRETVLRGAFRR